MAGWLLCLQEPATSLQQAVVSHVPNFIHSHCALFADGLWLFIHGICSHLSCFEFVPYIDCFYYINFKFLEGNNPYFKIQGAELMPPPSPELCTLTSVFIIAMAGWWPNTLKTLEHCSGCPNLTTSLFVIFSTCIRSTPCTVIQMSSVIPAVLVAEYHICLFIPPVHYSFY